MNAGAKYGMLLGLAFAASYFAGPKVQTALMIVLAMQSSLFTAVVWQRTRLPLITLAGVFAIFGCAAGAIVFYRELDLFAFSLPVVAFFAGAIIVPSLLAIESRIHPAEMNAWKEHMESASFSDILRGRHIPRLVK